MTYNESRLRAACKMVANDIREWLDDVWDSREGFEALANRLEAVLLETETESEDQA